MRRYFILLVAGVLSTSYTSGQIKKHFSVDNSEDFEEVNLSFKVKAGTCYIKPNHHTNKALDVYGNQDVNAYSHSFNKNIADRACELMLHLDGGSGGGLSSSISHHMFGNKRDESDELWKVYLAENKPYNLNLNYGTGSAHIDLSGLSVSNLKVHTGSADVKIGYFSGFENQISMDTFYVKVDLGSVKVVNLSQSNSKHVVADVGFGNLVLDFQDELTSDSDVKASVGAGNLYVVLPDEDIPVKVRINNSFLCGMTLSKSFRKIDDHTYVNSTYSEDADNKLFFDLDVSVGNIIFKEKKR
ncbi:MAG: hypothetical protein AAFX87_08375 [Bacteroidota bacterium]